MVVPLRIGLEIRIRPGRKRGAQVLLRLLDATLAVDGRMTAGEHDFGFPIQGAQKLALPAIPNTRADRTDVADGQYQQHFQPLQRLYALGEVLDRRWVAEIAPLRRVGHDQMILDDPGHGLGFGFRQPEARTETARKISPGARVILLSALRDI